MADDPFVPEQPYAGPVQYTSAAHVEQYASFCPICGAADIAGSSFDTEADLTWQRVDCMVCGASWKDIYKLQGYDYLTPGNQGESHA